MSRSCNAAVDSYAPPAKMAETEFEAAEVLAGLSNTQPSSFRGAESVDSWGSVRVKSESDCVDSAAANSVSVKKTVVLEFDLNEDQATVFNQDEECCPESKCVVKAELAEQNPACATSHTGPKSRQNLSPAEKEARRLRRVLANRESARQTIRRRQAVYEDLTRKVADLERENRNLKKEKESAVEDYHALKSTNKKLNEQIAEQSGPKQEETAAKSPSSNPPLPFANYPYIICKETPFVCPYNNTESSKRTPLSPNSHWCMVPYPLFIPMTDTKTAPNLIPFFPSRDKEAEVEVTTSSKRSLNETEAPIALSLDVESSCKEKVISHGKKRLVDPSVAAEARKRRRELKKMKSLHCYGHRKEGLRLNDAINRRSLSRNS